MAGARRRRAAAPPATGESSTHGGKRITVYGVLVACFLKTLRQPAGRAIRNGRIDRGISTRFRMEIAVNVDSAVLFDS